MSRKRVVVGELGPELNESLHRLELTGTRRLHEGCGGFDTRGVELTAQELLRAVSGVDVCTKLAQSQDYPDVTLAARDVERCRAELVRNVYVCAGCRERRYDFRVPVKGRLVDRCVASPVLLIDIGSLGDQRLDPLELPLLRRFG